jgi:leader peptidase (prepilin peptidase)/N-methyltransferase
VSAFLFLLTWAYLQPTEIFGFILTIKYLITLLILLAVFIIDLEHFLILDSIVFPGVAIVAVINLVLDLLSRHSLLSLHGNFFGGLVAAIVAALPFFLIWYFSDGEWMGFGDVKLALFLGVALGWPIVFVGIMLGVLSGGLLSAVLLLFTSKTLKSQIPFGTFLSFGAAIALFYGEKILHWYLAVLGF